MGLFITQQDCKGNLPLKETIKNTTLADRLLFILLIFVSIAGIFISRDALSQGSDVIIELDGKPAYTLPLYARQAHFP